MNTGTVTVRRDRHLQEVEVTMPCRRPADGAFRDVVLGAAFSDEEVRPWQ